MDQDDATALALRALGWILADDDRSNRLLDLTGLTPEALRNRLGEAAVLGAILKFLEQYQSDIVSCAEYLNEDPARLVAARLVLDPEIME